MIVLLSLWRCLEWQIIKRLIIPITFPGSNQHSVLKRSIIRSRVVLAKDTEMESRGAL